jgi:hypothetical protein
MTASWQAMSIGQEAIVAHGLIGFALFCVGAFMRTIGAFAKRSPE